MISRAHEWVVELLCRELSLGDLTILNCILDGVNMPLEGSMTQGYEFCRNRWILRWQEITSQLMNQDEKREAIQGFVNAAADWNSDGQLATSQRKRHCPDCPAGGTNDLPR